MLAANSGIAGPDLLLLLVHAVMLDTGFVGVSEVTARLSHVAMSSLLAESSLLPST